MSLSWPDIFQTSHFFRECSLLKPPHNWLGLWDRAIRPFATPGLKLTALRSVKILGTAKPGETLIFAAVVSGRFQNLIQAEATAELDGREILRASLTLSGDLKA